MAAEKSALRHTYAQLLEASTRVTNIPVPDSVKTLCATQLAFCGAVLDELEAINRFINSKGEQ